MRTGTWVRFLSLAMLPVLMACGGGGGGGGNEDVGELPALVYSGNTGAAVVTTTNAARLVSNIFGGDIAGALSPSAATAIQMSSQTRTEGESVESLTRRIKERFRKTLSGAGAAGALSGIASAVIPINETRPCDSGTVRTFGTLNDDGTGTYTVQYNNCRTGNETEAGLVRFRVDAFDLGSFTTTDGTATFTRLTIRGPGVSFDYGGSSRFQTNIAARTETTTFNAVFLNNLSGRMFKLENFVDAEVLDNIFFPATTSESYTGRIFDNVHGHIDVSTLSPLLADNLDQDFPDSGQIKVIDGGGRSVRATSLSEVMAKLELDLDANGTYEIAAYMKWAELNGLAGTNLGDDDGDGIHDTWEDANGLNKNDPTDAMLDNDGDGAGNMHEYRSGHDPRNASSIPPSVALSLDLSGPLSAMVIGNVVSYGINVRNFAFLRADDVVIKAVLPPGLSLISLAPSQGDCVGTSTIECDFGTIGRVNELNNGAGVLITASINTIGTKTSSVSVRTSSYESDLTDNVRVHTTIAGTSTAEIQSRVNDAPEGGTVFVSPGIYVGEVTLFKKVTLQSQAGPEQTTLAGKPNFPAIRMGNGSTVTGFSIAGTRDANAPMILLAGFDDGEEATIVGNLFQDTILRDTVAIEGSPLPVRIESNVFRNIDCPPSLNRGLIWLHGNGVPRILNNIFERNSCAVIDLATQSTVNSKIIGNTIVGNRWGIRVWNSTITGQAFRNNIIVGNGTGLEVAMGTLIGAGIWGHNLVFGNSSDYVGIATQTGVHGNISADPMFEDANAGNYRLKIGSPAIDSGSPIEAPLKDLDGTVRPLDGDGDGVAVMDIGAFEAPQIP
ncbi:MAG: choice-of-anchor Q domain-containing protein [Burkholderiales bacterium]